ncbi:hypothetical protein [Granulicella tundricola]|uniref:hypothetical protein n=1 Tax=Granulicella tundricola TaxID=940615 RepID=UPI0012F7BD6D
MREHCLLTCGIQGRCLQAAGYWKQGQEQQRDEDGEYQVVIRAHEDEDVFSDGYLTSYLH